MIRTGGLLGGVGVGGGEGGAVCRLDRLLHVCMYVYAHARVGMHMRLPPRCWRPRSLAAYVHAYMPVYMRMYMCL